MLSGANTASCSAECVSPTNLCTHVPVLLPVNMPASCQVPCWPTGALLLIRRRDCQHSCHYNTLIAGLLCTVQPSKAYPNHARVTKWPSLSGYYCASCSGAAALTPGSPVLARPLTVRYGTALGNRESTKRSSKQSLQSPSSNNHLAGTTSTAKTARPAPILPLA